MQRYVTLNEDNNTIKQISDTQFEGSVMVFVDPSKESTFIHSPFLCWVEQKDGNNILHIPEDAPAPSYEQKIEDFKKRIAELESNDTKHTSQLQEAEQKLKASTMSSAQLAQQLMAMQNQNGLLTSKINQLIDLNQKVNDQLNEANKEKDEANKEKDEAKSDEANKEKSSENPNTEKHDNTTVEKQTEQANGTKDEAQNNQQTPAQPNSYSVR